MEQDNNTTTGRGWQQISEIDRYKIEGWLQARKTPKEIAGFLGKNERTIKREIEMGVVQQDDGYKYILIYKADFAQRIHDERASRKGRELKIGHDRKLCEFIEKKIGEESYSPYAAIEAAKREDTPFSTMICYKTVYNMIDRDEFQTITNASLPVKRDGKKRDYRKIRKVALNNRSGKSIAERPESVDKREEKGHWEIDLVVGKQGTKPVVLTLVERKSRKSIYVLAPDKSQAEVMKAVQKARKRVGGDFSEVFKTITADNGSEFLDSAAIKAAANCGEVYYAHPYSSWERGSNENGNRMLRRFIPKGTDLSALTDEELQRFEDWVNNYPRRLHGGKTANDVYAA